MPLTAKHLGTALLTSTLSDIYTVPSSTKTRVTHIVFSNGGTAGSITLKHFDSSAAAAGTLLNAKAIAINSNVELFDLILEAGDKLQASAATTTTAEILIYGIEES